MAFVNVKDPNFIGLTPGAQSNPVPIFGSPFFGGPYGMTGITKDAGGTPHPRMVALLSYPTMKCLGLQPSDPVTGSFTWGNLKRIPGAPANRYFMTAHDPAGVVNAGIHDNLIPI